MGPRPTHLNLNSDDDTPNLPRPPNMNFHLDLLSPRAGEVPPALSPLDAFTMHSRLLAKQFEQEQQNGRRMSRLPPVLVQKEFSNRPEYFRNISGGSERAMSTMPEVREETSPTSPKGLAVTAGADGERPISHYPMFGHASRPSRTSPQPTPYYDAEEQQSKDYFGISAPRASSPEPVDPRLNVEAPSPLIPSLTSSIDSMESSQPRTLTNGSTQSQRSLRSERGLYPPKSPVHPKSPRSFQSIRSVPADSGDEDGSSFSGAYDTSSSRKFSGSSNMSRPHSPFSPYPPPMHRSPSMNSEYSNTGVQVHPHKQPSQRAFNFFRPMSSSGRSTPSVNTRPSIDNSLPRGRTVERNSIGLSESWKLHQFSWEENKPPPVAEPRARHRKDSEASAQSISLRPPSPAGSVKTSGTRLSRKDFSISSTANRSRSANPDARSDKPALHRASPSVQTESTDRTIRATPLHQRSPSAELSPEEHLEVGIQAHSAGELSKSTYHLRLAANAGLPTAMLLYALACRHGWGMRSNQEDGVMWLRKAIDTSGLEVIDVESTISNASRSPTPDPLAEAAERRKRKAQFALAIYELGISYMNGWGCPRDKPLAVRCYEVAGSWGDADALAEAGFCYMQGVGCKKDLKKAAMLYRKAAVLGMSMAGNSWIYKAKYMDDNPLSRTSERDFGRILNTPSQPMEKPRSRTRSIWSRKKDRT